MNTDKNLTVAIAKDGMHYVDSDFLNKCQGAILHSELKHLGFGDFLLATPHGNVTFLRTDYDNELLPLYDIFVGRPHSTTDTKNGELVKKLIVALDCKIINL